MTGNAATLIHEARTRAGLSQRQLAQRAGTSQAVISAYENNRRDPTLAHLVAIVRAAGLEVDLRLTSAAVAETAEGDNDAWNMADAPDEDDRILDNLRLSPAHRIRKMGELRDFSNRHRGSVGRR